MLSNKKNITSGDASANTQIDTVFIILPDQSGSMTKHINTINENRKDILPTRAYNCPAPEPNFVGRTQELKLLTSLYKSTAIRIASVIGFGGAGKSTLVRKWFDNRNDNDISPAGIFIWGFYGNQELEIFLDSLLRYLKSKKGGGESPTNNFAKIEMILDFLREDEYLIILDGLEVLQYANDEKSNFGKIKNKDMLNLLKNIADSCNSGLVLITSRLSISDLKSWNKGSFYEINLQGLSSEDGILLFQRFGVKGCSDEFLYHINSVEGHALTLSLIAKHVTEKLKSNIKEACNIPPVHQNNAFCQNTYHIFFWYENILTDDQKNIVEILSLFYGDINKIRLIEFIKSSFMSSSIFLSNISKMNIFQISCIIESIWKYGLVKFDEEDVLHIHPLIKSYFQSRIDPDKKRIISESIYNFLLSFDEKPGEDLLSMKPIFDQLYAGCLAGRFDEAFHDIYINKIQRGEKLFLTKHLSAWQTNLDLIINFFPEQNLKDIPVVTSKKDKIQLLTSAGISTLVNGDFENAKHLIENKTKMQIEEMDYIGASAGLRNLTTLNLRAGKIIQSKVFGRAAVEMSLRSKVKSEQIQSMCYFGFARFVNGNIEASQNCFHKAVEITKKMTGQGIIKGLSGHFYTIYLIYQNLISDAYAYATESYEFTIRNKFIDDLIRSLCCLSKISRISNKIDDSEKYIKEGLELIKNINMPYIEIELLIEAAFMYNSIEDKKNAFKALKKAMELSESYQFVIFKLDIMACCSIIDTDNSIINNSKNMLDRAICLSNSIGYGLLADNYKKYLK